MPAGREWYTCMHLLINLSPCIGGVGSEESVRRGAQQAAAQWPSTRGRRRSEGNSAKQAFSPPCTNYNNELCVCEQFKFLLSLLTEENPQGN